jgi:hypothetical protein
LTICSEWRPHIRRDFRDTSSQTLACNSMISCEEISSEPSVGNGN